MGGGNRYKGSGVFNHRQFLAQISQDDVLAQGGAPLVPVIVDNEGGVDVGDIGGIQNGKIRRWSPRPSGPWVRRSTSVTSSAAARTRGCEAASGSRVTIMA